MLESNSKLKKIPVWDLPVRLVHWSLVLLIIVAWVTTQDELYYDMTLHQYCGYTLLTLVIFRLLWGFWGSPYACFQDFLCGFTTTKQYLVTLFKPQPSHYIGHNPLGGWSVVLLLTLLGVQATTGLFANDDILTEGPLYAWISKDTSDWLTKIHKVNFNILLVFIAVHMSAIIFYRLVKQDNLVKPMITGYKWLSLEHTSKHPFKSLWRALIVLLFSGLFVWGLVTSHALWHGLF